MPTFPEVLREMMREQKMTTYGLAKRVGLRYQTVYRYTIDAQNNPRLSTILMLAKGLDVLPHEIVKRLEE